MEKAIRYPSLAFGAINVILPISVRVTLLITSHCTRLYVCLAKLGQPDPLGVVTG